MLPLGADDRAQQTRWIKDSDNQELRREFEYHAATVGAAEHGAAVQVASPSITRLPSGTPPSLPIPKVCKTVQVHLPLGPGDSL